MSLVLLVPGVGMGGGDGVNPQAADTYLHVGLVRGVEKPTTDDPGSAD